MPETATKNLSFHKVRKRVQVGEKLTYAEDLIGQKTETQNICATRIEEGLIYRKLNLKI
jgi:hypothetical protein